MRRGIFILLIAIVFLSEIIAQDNDTTSLFSLGLKVHRSFIIQHTDKLSEKVTSSHPWMIEADLNWHLRKQSIWDYCNCYPRTGIALLYTNFDLPQILGEAFSVYAFIEPFIRANRNLNYSIRFGMGPSFLSTLYDAQKNPDNLFFSTPVSFLVLLNGSVNYRINPRLTLRISGSYNHISNGGYSEPNLGMNFPSLSAGVDYSFRNIQLSVREPSGSKMTLDKKHRMDAFIGISAKPTTSGLREKRYPVYVLGVNYSYAATRILAVSGGAEWMIDRSLYHYLRETGTVNNEGDYPDYNRVGVLAGIDWLFGRFIFYQQFGVYLYSPVKALHPVYQRYGLNFRLTENIFAGINIKAHGQDADFMDFRVGWSF